MFLGFFWKKFGYNEIQCLVRAECGAEIFKKFKEKILEEESQILELQQKIKELEEKLREKG